MKMPHKYFLLEIGREFSILNFFFAETRFFFVLISIVLRIEIRRQCFFLFQKWNSDKKYYGTHHLLWISPLVLQRLVCGSHLRWWAKYPPDTQNLGAPTGDEGLPWKSCSPSPEEKRQKYILYRQGSSDEWSFLALKALQSDSLCCWFWLVGVGDIFYLKCDALWAALKNCRFSCCWFVAPVINCSLQNLRNSTPSIHKTCLRWTSYIWATNGSSKVLQSSSCKSQCVCGTCGAGRMKVGPYIKINRS